MVQSAEEEEEEEEEDGASRRPTLAARRCVSRGGCRGVCTQVVPKYPSTHGVSRVREPTHFEHFEGRHSEGDSLTRTGHAPASISISTSPAPAQHQPSLGLASRRGLTPRPPGGGGRGGGRERLDHAMESCELRCELRGGGCGAPMRRQPSHVTCTAALPLISTHSLSFSRSFSFSLRVLRASTLSAPLPPFPTTRCPLNGPSAPRLAAAARSHATRHDALNGAMHPSIPRLPPPSSLLPPQRGAILTTMILLYALTSFIGGFVGTSQRLAVPACPPARWAIRLTVTRIARGGEPQLARDDATHA